MYFLILPYLENEVRHPLFLFFHCNQHRWNYLWVKYKGRFYGGNYYVGAPLRQKNCVAKLLYKWEFCIAVFKNCIAFLKDTSACHNFRILNHEISLKFSTFQTSLSYLSISSYLLSLLDFPNVLRMWAMLQICKLKNGILLKLLLIIKSTLKTTSPFCDFIIKNIFKPRLS
jgi:hypothetical protein